MELIEYHPMPRHANATTGSTTRCRTGGAPLRGSALVPAGAVAGGGHAGARGDTRDRASVVSPLAPARPRRLESHRAAGSKTAARRPAAGPRRAGPGGGRAAARLPHRFVAVVRLGKGYRWPKRSALFL